LNIKRLTSKALGSLFLACALSGGLAAQTSDTDKKIADLEKQLEAVRAQIEALKTAPAPAPAAAVAPTAAAGATPAAAPAPNPLAGITSVLGGVNLTGLIDAYYTYNANHPALEIGGTSYNSTTPFNGVDSQISLNLLELQLDKPVDKSSPLGFRTAFGWGQAINTMNNNGSDLATSSKTTNFAPGAAQYLKEAYFSLWAPLGKGLQIDAGKFVTPAGVEVVESNQNWNYTRGLLFYYAIPYYHYGARAKYTFNDKFALTGYLVNGWNNVIATNSGKTGGVTLAWTPNKKWAVTENYLGGPRDILQTGNNTDWNHLFDTVVTYSPTAKLSLAGEFDYDLQELTSKTHADYTGIAAFAKYQASPTVAYAVRYEFLNDHDGLGTLTGQHLNEFTATAERKLLGHVISRLEYRHDQSNKDFFYVGKIGSNKTQDTATLGLMYVIEPSAN
jgi:hypothetical protein